MFKQNTKSNESLYIEILIWAYENYGFTLEKMWQALNITDAHKRQWVLDNFFYRPPSGDSPLIQKVPADKMEECLGLSERGILTAINYLSLKEAREDSKRATRIALTSIVIGIIVGLVQIIVQFRAEIGE